MLLKNTKYNPRPDPEADGYVTTPDNVKIRYARWKAATAPIRGTVMLLQGRTEYIEKGYEVIKELRKKGFEVISFDWRGQGGSERMLENPRKGYVDEFDEYVTDLETIVADVALPDCRPPFYVLAHSTGALVALLAAPKIPNKIRRMVLCSPLLGLGVQPVSQPTVKFAAGALTALGVADMYLGGSGTPAADQAFSGNVLTSDTRRFERNRKFLEDFDELAIGGPTAGWVFAACKAIEQVHDPDFYQQIRIPVLFIIAGKDRVVDNTATEIMAKNLRSGSSLTIDGAMHEIMQERDMYREQFLAALFSFIPGSERD